MRAETRRSLILQRIEDDGAVTVLAEAERFKTSPMTIRRDLLELSSTGRVRRVHGGAVAAHGRSYEPPYLVRAQEEVPAKRAIAEAAARLILEGDSVAVDTGSTCLEVARLLTARRNLTVVTPATRVADIIAESSSIRVISTGGHIRPGEGSMVGDLATRAFADLHVDRLILGCAGIDARFGTSDYNWDDVLVKKAMVASAKEVILVADARKFHHVAFARMCGLEDISVLVTNAAPDPDLHRALDAAGTTVIVAQSDN